MKREIDFHVRAVWDDEAKVWVATSDDIPGLITEADTCDALVEKLRVLIPELLEANGVSFRRHDHDFPIQLHTERTERICLSA